MEERERVLGYSYLPGVCCCLLLRGKVKFLLEPKYFRFQKHTAVVEGREQREKENSPSIRKKLWILLLSVRKYERKLFGFLGLTYYFLLQKAYQSSLEKK